MPAGEGAARTAPRAAVIVEFSGEVDIASADQARGVLSRAISTGSPCDVMIDLAQVTFMDCRGLSVLVSARNLIGDRLILHNPTPAVTRLLDLTDLRETFIVAGEHA